MYYKVAYYRNGAIARIHMLVFHTRTATHTDYDGRSFFSLETSSLNQSVGWLALPFVEQLRNLRRHIWQYTARHLQSPTGHFIMLIWLRPWKNQTCMNETMLIQMRGDDSSVIFAYQLIMVDQGVLFSKECLTEDSFYPSIIFYWSAAGATDSFAEWLLCQEWLQVFWQGSVHSAEGKIWNYAHQKLKCTIHCYQTSFFSAVSVILFGYSSHKKEFGLISYLEFPCCCIFCLKVNGYLYCIAELDEPLPYLHIMPRLQCISALKAGIKLYMN